MKTATIERYHVIGTPNYCVALFYRADELTPCEGIRLPEWIPADQTGIERLKALARLLKFTHIRFAGDWTQATKPKGGKL